MFMLCANAMSSLTPPPPPSINITIRIIIIINLTLVVGSLKFTWKRWKRHESTRPRTRRFPTDSIKSNPGNLVKLVLNNNRELPKNSWFESLEFISFIISLLDLVHLIRFNSLVNYWYWYSLTYSNLGGLLNLMTLVNLISLKKKRNAVISLT